MKITRDTPEQLILDHKPWIFAILLCLPILGAAGFTVYSIIDGDFLRTLIGSGITLFTAIFPVAFIRRVQLILDRGTGKVTLRRRGFINQTEDIFALSDLRQAYVQTSNSGDTKTHRPALDLDGQPHGVPILLVYTSGRGAGRDRDAINAWLARAVDKTPREA